MTEKSRHTKLTDKQKRFCEEYIIDNNAKQAAIRSGFSAKTAEKQGPQLLEKTWVRNYIRQLQRKLRKKSEISAERVLAEYAKIAFSDIREIFDENGCIKDVNDMPEAVSGVISEIRTTSFKTKNGDDIIKTSYKLHSKVSALEALSKHLGLFEKDNKQKGESQQPTILILPSNNRDQQENE